MHVQNCLHPYIVRNKYTGEKVVTSCGHCAACISNKARHWVTRLDLEASCHKYVWFATFTYDEQHINQVIRLRYDDYTDGIAYIDSSSGEIFEFSDSSIKRHNKQDFAFCRSTKVLPILSKIDVQKFIKRLRYYIKQLDKNAILRYFYTGEIGPTTYRPHGHALFFLDSDIVNQEFENLLYKSWKNGNVFQPHLVSGSASNYVASYVNGFTSLPSIYQHKSFRPFTLFSKCPPIGTLVKSLQDVPRLLDRKDCTFRVFSSTSKEFIDVPLWRSLLDRYYPRIQRFSELSVADRATLYGLAERHYFEDKWQFADFLYQRYVRSKNGAGNFINNYLYDICHISRKTSFSLDGRKSAGSFSESHISSLVRFAGILLRVRAQASVFGLSIKDYVIKISDYYDTVSHNQLITWYQWQDEYFKNAPVRDFLLMDYSFVNRVNGKPFSTLSSADQFYLKFYGVVDASTDIVHLSLDDSIEYRVYKFNSIINASRLEKTKKINDDIQYKLNDFVNYQKIL